MSGRLESGLQRVVLELANYHERSARAAIESIKGINQSVFLLNLVKLTLQAIEIYQCDCSIFTIGLMAKTLAFAFHAHLSVVSMVRYTRSHKSLRNTTYMLLNYLRIWLYQPSYILIELNIAILTRLGNEPS